MTQAANRLPTPTASAAILAFGAIQASSGAANMLLIQEDYRASNEGHYSSDSRVATIDALAMRLASRWAKVTRNMSSLRQMQKTPEFEQLIALGRDAVPSLLGMYRSAASGHLFLVLQTITGENPVPPNDYGDPEAIRRAWIEWGRRDASDHG